MSSDREVRIAVIGGGSFGKNHLRVIHQTPGAVLAGVVDTNPARVEMLSKEHSCPGFAQFQEIIGRADAAVISTPTTTHCEIGCALLDAGLDVLVEKPIAATLEEAKRLTETAARQGRILQVGHLERFNPAVEALEAQGAHPLFFEIHRLSMFTPRSLDVDVVLDLMIHDLEIVLALTGMMPEEIRAAGIQILSSRVDIANVRLQFPGGCVANLTASRASTEQVRKLRLFAPHQYLSLDYSRQDLVAVTVSEGRQISFKNVAVSKDEPLKREIADFVACIRSRHKPRVSGVEATRALEVALDILGKIEEHAQVVARSLGSS